MRLRPKLSSIIAFLFIFIFASCNRAKVPEQLNASVTEATKPSRVDTVIGKPIKMGWKYPLFGVSGRVVLAFSKTGGDDSSWTEITYILEIVDKDESFGVTDMITLDVKDTEGFKVEAMNSRVDYQLKTGDKVKGTYNIRCGLHKISKMICTFTKEDIFQPKGSMQSFNAQYPKRVVLLE